MRTPLAWAASLLIGGASLAAVPAAQADSASVSTPVGAMAMTLDGGAFTEECTDFPYDVVVSDALPRVQWSAEITAEREGGEPDSITDPPGRTVSGMLTGFGSGTFDGNLQICSGDGAGAWTATVDVRMADPADATAVYERTMTLTFAISKAPTTTTITRVTSGSSQTKVKGTVADARVTMFGDVTVKVKKPDASWKTGGSGTVDDAGNFTVTIGRTYPSGTKVKVVFEGTDEAKRSTSATSTI